MALEQVKFVVSGGVFKGAGSVKNAPGGGDLVAQAALTGVDVARLWQSAGAPPGQIAADLMGRYPSI
jgi:hypothetical protein